MKTNSTIQLKLKRGLDLPLKGEASAVLPDVKPSAVAIYPDDFPGITPKLDVKEGDEVAIGSPLMHDKEYPDIVLASPAAGVVKEVLRGSRRKIIRVVVTPSDGIASSAGSQAPKSPASRQEAVSTLCRSGLWAWMRQLPYAIVPRPDVTPRDIFVTGFDSAPLAVDFSFYGVDEGNIKAGTDYLSHLTEGKIYISKRPGQQLPEITGVTWVDISGPHPAGNPDVMVNHISPVNKGETVWTLDLVTLDRIGAWVLTGVTASHTCVAITGPEAVNRGVVRTLVGADMRSVLSGHVADDGKNHRVIAGNVLTGVRSEMDGFLHFPYRQVTVIAEGDDKDEMLGWASLSPNKMSASRTFLSAYLPKRKLSGDALLHGGRRAMIMSGVYDRMLPMDIMLEPLIKAILSQNIEDMEALGIYEIAPEDVAVAEWADPSKLELQKIVREGLDYMRREA